MGDLRAIQYKDVKKAFGSDAEAKEAWTDIGTISGAGSLPAEDDAVYDITDLSEEKTAQIDKLLAGSENGLNSLTVAQLQEKAKALGLDGNSTMKKAELIVAIEHAQENK